MSNTEDHKEGNVYELGYLILPSIPEDNLSNVVDSMKKIVNEAGATLLDSEDPFMHDLAYSMSKTVGASKYVVNEAYIGWMKFELAKPEESELHPIESIKASMDKMNEILRYLLVKAPRDTTFTFAAARAARMERENLRNQPVEEASSDTEAEEPKDKEESEDSEKVAPALD